MPEYVIVALAAAIVSVFAGKLGAVLHTIREWYAYKTSQKPHIVSTSSGIVQLSRSKRGDSEGGASHVVELFVKQPDGSYEAAAEGKLDSKTINQIIKEMRSE